MKKNQKKLYASFAPEPRFEVEAPSRAQQELEFQKLKKRLLQQLLRDIAEPQLYLPFQQAAGEAAALSWTTQFPLLLFPGLLWEKARKAQLRTEKQNEVFSRSRRLLVETA